MIEAIKILVGGLLAAPIAYLLLMWVFSRDPLGLVPTLNAVAPAIVPDKLNVSDQDDLPPSVNDDDNDSADLLSDSEFESDFEDVEVFESDDSEIP